MILVPIYDGIVLAMRAILNERHIEAAAIRSISIIAGDRTPLVWNMIAALEFMVLVDAETGPLSLKP